LRNALAPREKKKKRRNKEGQGRKTAGKTKEEESFWAGQKENPTH